MIAVTQARMHPPGDRLHGTQTGRGETSREALRCLERHLARVVFKTILRAEHETAWRVARAECAADSVAIAV